MGKWRESSLGKLGYTYSGLTGKKGTDFGYGLAYIPYINVFNNLLLKIDHLEYVQIQENERQNCVKKGDVFFTTSSETPEEVGMSSVLMDALDNTFLNSFCFGYRLFSRGSFDSVFFAYVLRSIAIRKQMFVFAQGSTRYNLSKKNFNNVRIKYPIDIQEQSKIAEILSTIDTVIEKTKTIIEKYKRIKTGMMRDLLANGIDEKGNIRSSKTHKYKDSPIGKIPVEWEYGAVSDFAFINPKTHFNLLINDEVDFIPMQGVNEDGIWDIKETKLVKDCMRGFTIFSENDILFAKITPCMENGKGCMVRNLKIGIGFGSTEFHVLRSKNNSIPDYIYYWTVYHRLRNKAIAYMGGSAGQQRVSTRFFYDFLIEMPKKDEQLKIIEKLLSIDTKIQTEQAYLKKLQRMKQGLMRDLLTHKVAVDALL